MPEEQETNREEAHGEKCDEYIIKTIFPIEIARQNTNNYLQVLHTKKFANKIISAINYGIRCHSEHGESEAQIVFSLFEIFGDYPIQKHINLLQTVLDTVVEQFTDGGYQASNKLVDTIGSIKGFVFTISWNEQSDENTNEEGE